MADNILVVDNEVNYLMKIEALLKECGHEVITATSTIDALEIAVASDPDLVITELKMPKMGGLEFLDEIHRLYSDLPVIIMTTYASVEQAVKAIKKGAFDLILKHYKAEETLGTIGRALEHRHLLRNLLKYDFANIVGESQPMREILDLVKRVAHSRLSVLITGESGTGKDLMAMAIRHSSHLDHKSFVLASSLFGHERGVFTHAMGMHKSIFKLDNGGTLFIDELADMSQELQAEILWLLQEIELEQVGATHTTITDVRVVGASSRDLKEEMKAGRLREDLYYRINGVHLYLPPLRQRQEDIPLLAAHFTNKYAQEYFKGNTRITPEALEVLVQYPWPGNVRELENVMERAVILCSNSVIGPQDLPVELFPASGKSWLKIDRFIPLNTPLSEALETIEEQMIRRALEKSGQVQVRAAELLGITKSLLQYKMKKYNLTS